MGRFEHLALRLHSSHGGKVIKMIGDEVLFTSERTEAASEIALEFLEACAADPIMPQVRIGLAAGPTLLWEGDVYGPHRESGQPPW